MIAPSFHLSDQTHDPLTAPRLAKPNADPPHDPGETAPIPSIHSVVSTASLKIQLPVCQEVNRPNLASAGHQETEGKEGTYDASDSRRDGLYVEKPYEFPTNAPGLNT